MTTRNFTQNLFEMFGIVKAKTPLVSSKIVGIKNVKSQKSPMTIPMTIEPVTLPSLPTIIEMQTAIARILVGKSSTVEALTTLIPRPARSMTMYKYIETAGTWTNISKIAQIPVENITTVKMISFPILLITKVIIT